MGAGFRVKARANKAAEVLLYEDIGEIPGFGGGGVSAKAFREGLSKLGPVNAIDVRINSYGGDVFEGLAIYRALVDHGAEITTHVDGVAASIASVIAMAGRTINIAEAGSMMIHEAWGVAGGNAAKMREMADRLEGISGQIATIYAARTGRPAEDVRAMMASTRWFTAHEAVEHGFATGIAENLRVAAYFGDLASVQARGIAPPSDLRPTDRTPPPGAGRPEYDRARAEVERMLARSGRARLLDKVKQSAKNQNYDSPPQTVTIGNP